MCYEYSGYLRQLLYAPDEAGREDLEYIEFSAKDLANWNLLDDEGDREWQHIPAIIEGKEEGVTLRGHFEDVRRITNLGQDNPRFWVALSSRRVMDARFPIDTRRFPIIEITYRCKSEKALPAWQWRYPGGFHCDFLEPSTNWRTLAHLTTHAGFPQKITGLTLRLYSATQTTEAVEVRAIRFRAMSPTEREAYDRSIQRIEETPPPPHYTLLEEFVPIGVYMDAGEAKRLANTMSISFNEYWRLALEDIVRHEHNCIALKHMEALSREEWETLLGCGRHFGVRFFAQYDWDLDRIEEDPAYLQHQVETYIAPWADSDALFAWSLCAHPSERQMDSYQQARRAVEAVDKRHPVAVVMEDPNIFPLYAPHFAASGLAHYKSHVAWEFGELVRTHYPLSRGQHLWVQAPAFVYATETPEWYTCPEMRLIINQAFANGGRGWFTEAYHNEPIWMGGHSQRTLTGAFLTFSDLWAEMGQRMRRFSIFAPLFLHTTPHAAPPFAFEVEWEEHPKAQRSKRVAPIDAYWLKGPDYWLYYLVSNDISEVTPVNLRIPEQALGDQEVFDITDFVRSRMLKPMKRERHYEMFPGQGQILLVASREAALDLRDIIIKRIIAADTRQLELDKELAIAYNLDLNPVQVILDELGASTPEDDLYRTSEARDCLENMLYAADDLSQARSRIIQASAALCGCDGALCRIVHRGKETGELGEKVLPLSQEMVRLRLLLRQGKGAAIHDQCVALAENSIALLTEIRAQINKR